MEKNWLIRTHSNQILGPISREKVIELVSKNALSETDELCSGNGYWFYLREKDLFKKYITEKEIQSFNPVTETIDILTAGERDRHAGPLEMREVDDITNIVQLKEALKAEVSSGPVIKEKEMSVSYPKDEDLDFPNIGQSLDPIKKK